jgi:L-seryl-tRNA(Ser) seleniumtransferase
MILRSVPDRVVAALVDGSSEVGGGSLPGQTLPTKLVALSVPDSEYENPLDLARAFRMADPPVLGRVGDGRFVLDLRTVEDAEIPAIVGVFVQILHK